MGRKIRIHGLGASNHSDYERAKNDYYSTDPIAITLLDKYDLLDNDNPYFETVVCGGALADELTRLGYNVTRTLDLIDRNYPNTIIGDFFEYNENFNGNLITNPPYNKINDWILHSLELASDKVYIFCRIQTLESYNRYNKIFKDNPPVYVCPFVKRVNCYRDDDQSFKKKGSTICYSWFIWDNKDNSNETRIKWLI